MPEFNEIEKFGLKFSYKKYLYLPFYKKKKKEIMESNVVES